MFARAESEARGNQDRGNVLLCECLPVLFITNDVELATDSQRGPPNWLEILRRERLGQTNLAAKLALQFVRLCAGDVMRFKPQRLVSTEDEDHETLPEPAETFLPHVLPL